MTDQPPGPRGTGGSDYTERLVSGETARWKQLLDVRAPYRRHLRRLGLGKTLDVGCGIGRNLVDLEPGSVGVDHNPHSISVARKRGCAAFTPEEFVVSAHAAPGSFDSMLVAHVVEHMTMDEAEALLAGYLDWVRDGGRVVLITPQRAGFRSDPTHVEYAGFAELAELVRRLGLDPVRSYSFPLPRSFGSLFRYNECVVISRRPSGERR